MQIFILLSITGFIVLVYYFRQKKISARRSVLENASLPQEWLEIIERNVPIYSKLPRELKTQLHGLINIFVSEKNFEGSAGLVITDEIKVTIAAQACILLLNRKTNYYPNLSSIIVYPSSYIAEGKKAMGSSYVNVQQHRLGESWNNGLLVLSWDDVLRGAFDINDGHNVVFHEFAHQLDQDYGPADGLPKLENRSNYISWAKILTKEYDNLLKDISSGHKTVMDSYGATNPAEFFAVLSETFFEKPAALQKKHPELFNEFVQFYKVDPISWHSN